MDDRGLSVPWLHERVNDEGLKCSVMTVYNWLNGVTKKIPPDFYKIVARILELDYDALMDPMQDSLRAAKPSLLYVDQTSLGPLLLKVLQCPTSTDEDKATAAKHIAAWLQTGHNPEKT